MEKDLRRFSPFVSARQRAAYLDFPAFREKEFAPSLSMRCSFYRRKQKARWVIMALSKREQVAVGLIAAVLRVDASVRAGASRRESQLWAFKNSRIQAELVGLLTRRVKRTRRGHVERSEASYPGCSRIPHSRSEWLRRWREPGGAARRMLEPATAWSCVASWGLSSWGVWWSAAFGQSGATFSRAVLRAANPRRGSDRVFGRPGRWRQW